MIRFSGVAGFAGRLYDRVRKQAAAAVDAARRRAQQAIVGSSTQVVIEDDPNRMADRLGFNVRLMRAITQGAAPWDVKQGLLAKAKKHGKDGSPYVDVPINMSKLGNVAEQSSLLAAWQTRGFRTPGQNKRGTGTIMFRRVSLRSPWWSWIHPGFGGGGQPGGGRMMGGAAFGPGRNAVRERSERDPALKFSDDSDEALRNKLVEAAQPVRDLKKEGRR